jgi:hypothetical protein
MGVSAETKLVTSRFLTSQARGIAAAARAVALIEDEPVRAAVRYLYDLGKQLDDARAKEIAANSRPEPKLGRPTNVGDPNAKGIGGKKR